MRKLVLITAICLLTQQSFAQNLNTDAIHRIGDYGKIWCALKLFHPELAYDNVNSDSLFTDYVDGLLSNPSASNFRTAVGNMLRRLHDPYTTIDETSNEKDSVQLPSRPLLKWVADSIALVHFDNEFMSRNYSDFSSRGLAQFVDSIKNAHGIIIDLRQAAPDNYADDYAPLFMKQLISVVAPHNVTFPSFRTRIHYGHESETFNSSFYYQGWVLQNGSVVNLKQKTIHKPICLLVNRFNKNVSDAIAVMQQENIAKVIADDSLNGFEPATTYEMELADSMIVHIRLSEVVYSNGNTFFVPDLLIPRTGSAVEDSLIHAAIELIRSKKEIKSSSMSHLQRKFRTTTVNGYESLTYPPPSLRLLGLMRYWSTIRYFCANKDLITKNWDSVLYQYVPKFLNAKDSLDYALTVARLIKEINDGHGFFGSSVHDRLMATGPEIQLNYVQKKTIVYKVFNDSLKSSFAAGDEVIAINGRSVKNSRDSIAQYIGASNDAALQRDVTTRLLAGPANSFVTVTYLHNAAPKTIKLQRTIPWYQYYFTVTQTGPRWKKISDKIGYVDFGRLEVSQIDSMFHDLNNTDAIILDDRSYPRGTVWTLVSYLTDKTVTSAKGTTMIADSPDPFIVTMQDQLWQIPVTPQPIQYKGKIIVLVNETTQSQAEYSCMVLQGAYKKVTIIGSQTAGADGDVTGIMIPGGIRTAFSGHGVRYPDGRPTQGIGIVPDIKISPTIKGIKEGRDEVLERAIAFAKNGK